MSSPQRDAYGRLIPGCPNCKHFNEYGFTCTAFPDGIPAAITAGVIDHLTPVPGDGGIVYEPREEWKREQPDGSYQ